jgi:hypothetical protein
MEPTNPQFPMSHVKLRHPAPSERGKKFDSNWQTDEERTDDAKIGESLTKYENSFGAHGFDEPIKINSAK